ncbi:protein PET100 homolog, mitochondrial [Nerophis ophidion]|uniref:protein PET100 homolog, mitochondrial n=1 Tax=Nerophis ophidion TaxID=159077 RepID=UPI002AE0178D|nr:protein PET100 homolog, mitochondrial [Nerophis ophidion]
MGVKLEICKMIFYVTFPVTMFWISNQPDYFEEYVLKKKREMLPPNEAQRRKEYEEFKERMRVRNEQRLSKKISMESEN